MDAIRIIPYEDRYRDDMIFMILAAKDALGRVPTLNPDLLDVPGHYLRRGGGFFLAVDGGGRVVGSAGFSRIDGTDGAFVHRLYVKPSLKRRGVGSALLAAVERGMRGKGVRVSWVHLGEPREQWFESYAFYPKHGYLECKPRYMKKDLDGTSG